MSDSTAIGGDVPLFSLIVPGFFGLTSYVADKNNKQSYGWQTGGLSDGESDRFTALCITYVLFPYFYK